MTEPETEKYGVEETVDEVKTGAEGARKCPVCASGLRPSSVTGVLLCGKCGSLPFETDEAHGTQKPR